MNARDLQKFFLSIVLPSILAITLFIISFYYLNIGYSFNALFIFNMFASFKKIEYNLLIY